MMGWSRLACVRCYVHETKLRFQDINFALVIAVVVAVLMTALATVLLMSLLPPLPHCVTPVIFSWMSVFFSVNGIHHRCHKEYARVRQIQMKNMSVRAYLYAQH